MNVRIIANPIAGGGKSRLAAEELRAYLTEHVDSVELRFTERKGDAEAFAGESGADVVVSVGGDGSANEVVNGMRGTSAALAILPMGTANVVARELKLPKRAIALGELIVSGQYRWMDVGMHAGRRFLLGAGAGLDAAIVSRVMANRAKKSSLWRWVWPTISTCFTYGFPKMQVHVDGELVSDEGQYALVGNCRFSAGVFRATPRAKIDDGLLDVCILRKLNWVKLMRHALLAPTNRFLRHPDVLYFQGKRVEFLPNDSEIPLLQVDGDPAGWIPATFSIEPRAVRVVAQKM
ncbi:MAG: diacylglycerol kinase family protein [Candidatus Hydrogenedentota bacterium]